MSQIFLGTRSIFCPNDATSGESLHSWSPERPRHDQRVGIFSPPLHLWGGGRHWRLRSPIAIGDNQWWMTYSINETSIKNSKWWGSENFWVGECIKVLGRWYAHRGHGNLMHPSPYFALCTCSTWLFLVVSFNTIQVIARVSWFLQESLPNYPTLGGSLREPCYIDGCSEV